MVKAKKKTARKTTKKTTRKTTRKVAKKTTRKPAKKVAAKRKTTAKKKAVKMSSSAIRSKQTQAQIVADIAANTDMKPKEVRAVFEALKVQVGRHVGRGGSGEMAIPGLGLKVKKVHKKARPARRGINPFTGEEMMFKAKPASKSVRATALKALKELAE
jgi:nucleoid DNA-binding protein